MVTPIPKTPDLGGHDLQTGRGKNHRAMPRSAQEVEASLALLDRPFASTREPRGPQ